MGRCNRTPRGVPAVDSRRCQYQVCYDANTGDIDAAAERNVTSWRRRHRRSVSVERNVETLVVVDPSMMEYYKNEHIENYVLTIMNMVRRPHNMLTHHCTYRALL